MKKILTIFLLLALISIKTTAQSIRKDYREFTLQEMNDYVAAFNILFTNGTIPAFVSAHSGHAALVHTIPPNNGELFLPWHRYFLNDIEQRMRATNAGYAYLSIPYWNWTTDQNNLSSTFWSNGFLNASKFPGWGFTRNIGGTLPSVTDLNNNIGLTTFFINTTAKGPTSSDFSHRLEYNHDIVHGWVGGTMNNISTSPGDPIFYVHHCMVDKVWQQWEDLSSGFQSIFLTGTTPMIHYSTPEYAFNVTPNSTRDSRSLLKAAFAGPGRNADIWFADNGKVLLDGANGSAFIATDASVSYTYRYTAATSAGSTTFGGDMYVGDVLKDASGSVLDDNKGGFEINSTVKCNFLSGHEIIFRNGFWAHSGSEVAARIITTPNEAAPLSKQISNTLQDMRIINEEPSVENSIFSGVRIFPNPVNDRGFIQYGLKEIAHVSVTLIDANGRTIKVIEDQIKDAGNYTTEINTSNLSQGVYFYKVTIGQQIKVFKVVKQGVDK